MVSTTGSDFILTSVLWITAGFTTLCILLLLIAAALRYRARYMEAQEQRICRRWRPILNQAIANPTAPLPALPALPIRHRPLFLEYWCIVHAQVRGSGDTALNQLAHELYMDDWITHILRHGEFKYRLAALSALGYFASATPEQLRLVRNALNHPGRVISITALRCLLNLNTEDGMQELERCLMHKHWSDSRLMSALQDAPTAPVLEVLHRAILNAPRRVALKCYRLCERLRGYTDQEETYLLLQRFPHDSSVAAQFLRLVNLPGLLPEVRPFLKHDHADIRALAITAIGRLGSETELPHICPLLADDDPWVRYDTAATLLLMPGVDEAMIENLCNTLPDSLGRTTLRQLAPNRRGMVV
ncbi:HEAT repeat domain-containing protein [Aliidiomarina sp. Khilg15.8]